MAAAEVTGQPAVSLPLGWSADGLPLGVQLVAAPGREDLLAEAGLDVEGIRAAVLKRWPQQGEPRLAAEALAVAKEPEFPHAASRTAPPGATRTDDAHAPRAAPPESAAEAASNASCAPANTGGVTASPHVELLPFLREQAVSVTKHRFGTPLDLAAGLL